MACPCNACLFYRDLYSHIQITTHVNIVNRFFDVFHFVAKKLRSQKKFFVLVKVCDKYCNCYTSRGFRIKVFYQKVALLYFHAVRLSLLYLTCLAYQLIPIIFRTEQRVDLATYLVFHIFFVCCPFIFILELKLKSRLRIVKVYVLHRHCANNNVRPKIHL